jgi:hypothetical protein
MAITFLNIVVGEGNLSVDGSDVGATQDGAEIAWEPDMVDIEIDQFGDAARIVQSKQKVSMKTKLAEATLENLALVWGYDDADIVTVPSTSKTLPISLHSVYPEEHTLVLVGNAPGSTATTTYTRTYTNGRAVQYSSSSHMLKRAENVAFPVDFRILPDPTQSGQEYGTIVDEIA